VIADTANGVLRPTDKTLGDRPLPFGVAIVEGSERGTTSQVHQPNCGGEVVRCQLEARKHELISNREGTSIEAFVTLELALERVAGIRKARQQRRDRFRRRPEEHDGRDLQCQSTADVRDRVHVTRNPDPRIRDPKRFAQERVAGAGAALDQDVGLGVDHWTFGVASLPRAVGDRNMFEGAVPLPAEPRSRHGEECCARGDNRNTQSGVTAQNFGRATRREASQVRHTCRNSLALTRARHRSSGRGGNDRDGVAVRD
jgi:hypothetical protein